MQSRRLKIKLHNSFVFSNWPQIQVIFLSGQFQHLCILPCISFIPSKSFLEALICISTNQQYDKRLFIESQVQYRKIPISEHVYINCSEWQNKKQFVYTTCSELVVFMYWTGKSMNNLLSYCWLVDPRISASDKDLPVQKKLCLYNWSPNC